MRIEISIVVPCYKQAQYLDETLNSVLMQTNQHWECIIVDDGSPDDTALVASEWCKRDSRFIYIYKKNAGLSAARNSGIESAKGDFILPLDSDDKIGEDYVNRALEVFKNEPDLALVYCNAEKFGIEEGQWHLPEFSLYKLSRNNLIFSSAIFKKNDWVKVGGYDPKMIYGWEDWEFWISILKNGAKVKRLDYIGFYYRIKNQSMLKSIDQQEGDYLLRYISIKHADFFVEHYGAFHHLIQKNTQQEQIFCEKLKSEKFIIDAFLNKFLGFTIFGMLKKNQE